MEIKQLSFAADRPPLSVLAAAKVAAVLLPTPTIVTDSSSPPTIIFSNGMKLQGTYVLLRYIGRVAGLPNFYGKDAFQSSQIDEWLEYSSILSSGSEFENACTYIDSYLEKRTFLVGYYLSIADMAIWSGLAATGQRWESLRKSQKYPSLVVNRDMSEKGKVGSKTSEVDLPDAEIGKVYLRFAPEPSGFLHIGHAKAALLNQYFAQDYFDKLMEKADELIRQGKAYVDDTPREQMQKERMDGIESKCRNNSVEESLKLWKEMIKGSERGLQCCLRGKLDMQDPNKSLRDPVYYRCNPVPHHRIGSKYNVYPTYDFACPYVDAIEGISHALRSSEYHDRNAQYHRIQEDLGCRKVDGWDDPRFPTVQGIVRRGLKVEALVQFILEQEAKFRFISFVYLPHLQIHKKYEGAGEKATTYTKRIWIDYDDANSISENEEVTLMDWGNAIVKEIVKDESGKVTQLIGVLHLDGSVKTTKLKLTWLPEIAELVNILLVEFDYLITKKKLEEGENFLDVLNPGTKRETAALGDSNMRNLKRGEILQLERKGYFRCDVPFIRPSKPIVLFAIPDGRQATSSK
ncbi:hypothetical protein GH714_006651 [Hevea brasiliensis]|uniref:glutamate--tRNA ligase n=1 Tax=Hevea brasiliensis TaxID=3981 RepID=A0A6A6NG17_HEVBR|nr:hypothetical protein GH714_006651 [Hevea brasiliensis]